MRMAVFVALLLPGLAFALEVAADSAPSWLDKQVRPRWENASFATVWEDLAKEIELPFDRSRGARVMAEEGSLVLIETERRPLRQVLEAIERSHRLCFTAEKLRLRVETVAERRERLRRPVRIDLQAYGVGLRRPDLLAPPLGLLGFNGGMSGGAGFDFFGGGVPEITGALDPETLMQRLLYIADDTVADLGSLGEVTVRLTAQEEVAVLEELDAVFADEARQSTWTVTAGLLPAGSDAAPGVVPLAMARALAAKLEAPRRLEATGMAGQVVHAEAAESRSYLGDVDVAGGSHLDATVSALRSGLSLQVQALASGRATHLALHLAWVEPVGGRSVLWRVPATKRGASISTTNKGTVEKGEEADDVEVEAGSELSLGGTQPGQRVPLELPAVWSWRPTIECFVPAGHAIVLQAPHAAGTAVMIIEEVR